MCVSAINSLPLFRQVYEKVEATFKEIDPNFKFSQLNNHDLTGIDADLKKYQFRTKLALGILATVVAVTLIAALAIPLAGIKFLVIVVGLAALTASLAFFLYNVQLKVRLQEVLDEKYYGVIKGQIEQASLDPYIYVQNAYGNEHKFLSKECFQLAINKNFPRTALYILECVEKFTAPSATVGDLQRPDYVDLRGYSYEDTEKGDFKEIKTLAEKLQIPLYTQDPQEVEQAPTEEPPAAPEKDETGIFG